MKTLLIAIILFFLYSNSFIFSYNSIFQYKRNLLPFIEPISVDTLVESKKGVIISKIPLIPSNNFLLEPENASIVYNLQPLFRWGSSQGVYQVKVSRNQFFNPRDYVSKRIAMDSIHYLFGDFLRFNTVYYWTSIGISDFSTFTTYNPLISFQYPEENYISTVKPIYLQWNRPKGDVTFNLQISKNQNFTSNFYVQEYNYSDTVYNTDWLIKNKQYYWRVQAAYGPIGNTWSETRSILVLDTTLQKVFPDSASSVTDTAITLRWNKLEGTNNYTVKLSSSPQFFTTLVDSSTVLDTFLHVPKLEKNKIYYWTVSSSTDVVNVPSNVWRFTTQTKPQLVEPPNKLADAPKLINFKWRRQGQLSASSFFQLSDKADFSTLIEDISDILDTTYFYDGTNTLKQNTTYHWRVKQLVSDDTTAWSNIWTFRLPGLPMVSQRYPDSNAIGIPVDTLLHWNSAADVDGYTVRVSTVPNFTTTVLERTPIMSVLQTDIKNLEHNRRYYWQTRTRKDSEFGEWSDVWDFLTILAKPNLLQPTNDITIAPTDVNFTWQQVNGAESYDLKVSTDSTFATTVVNESGITASNFEYKSLEKETTYYWQVKSNSSKNLGQWSDVKRFTTNSLTSVHEGENVGIEIIPNPVSNVSKILIHTNSNEQLYSVTVSNILGISVMTFPINNSKEFTLNANGFPQGIYFLEVTTSKKSFVYPFQLLR